MGLFFSRRVQLTVLLNVLPNAARKRSSICKRGTAVRGRVEVTAERRDVIRDGSMG